MPGIFGKANRPKLPGAYFNFQNQIAQAVPAAPGSVCAIIFTHDWGPLDVATRCSSFSEFQAIFGDSDDTDGFLAVKQAFLGENLDGRNGAGEVVALRINGSAGAEAAITINKTGGGAGITLTAVYEGTVGNALTATVTDAAGSTDRLTIYKGTVEVERYEYTQTDITDLAAQINKFSDWVVASGVSTGTALDQATDGPLIGGNNGTTLVNADWTAGLNVLETENVRRVRACGLRHLAD